MDRVVRRDGIDAFSTADVAREAGISRASIYDYFPTREALVVAFEERMFADGVARVGALVVKLLANPPPLEHSVILLVEAVLAGFARKSTAFGYREGVGTNARSHVRAEVVERAVALIANALVCARERARVRVEKAEVSVRVVVYATLDLARVLADATMTDEEKRLHGRELARMICRYLLADAVDVPHDRPVERA
jgi:AcrR family transcriptional regulator